MSDFPRSWAVSFPLYAPVDITPPELLEGLARSVAEGWAEPFATPAQVPDWFTRQAVALVPFDFDNQGQPLNPAGRTGRSGRNLGKWGENQARRVLLIKRSDIGAWAIPGGMVDPGESAPAALVRELREETGVDLRGRFPVVLDRRYVEDWRASDHAWVTSTIALYQLPASLAATAADDAIDAAWWPLDDLNALVAATLAPIGGLYDAHTPLLALALNHLAAQDADSAEVTA